MVGNQYFSMPQQSPPFGLVFFYLFVSVSCFPSTALLLPPTRGSSTDTASLWIIPPSINQDLSRDEEEVLSIKNRIASEKFTRKLFLSSVSTMGIFTKIPQLAIAKESNKIGSSDNNSIMTTFSHTKLSVRVLSITLRSLPVSGCWAAAVTLSQTLDSDDDRDFYTYLAVVDTGSPFLTAPMGALSKTKKIATTTLIKKDRKQTKLYASITNNSESDVTYEQYGTTVGSVQWRMAPYLTLIGNDSVENMQSSIGYPRKDSDNINGRSHSVSIDDDILLETEIEPIIIQDQTNVVLGIPSEEVVAETGGIFLGLMTVDVARPTPLQQLGYDAFAMRFRDSDSESQDDKGGRIRKKKDTRYSKNQARLILWNGKQSDATSKIDSMTTVSLIDPFDPFSMKLFDLTSYGPNLHHYGVLCDRFECRWGGNEEFDAISFDCDLTSGINSCTSARVSLPGLSLSRPLVAVFDTGLSGCIFSDTLWEEIQLERRRLKQRRKNKRRGGVRSMNSFGDVEFNVSNSKELPPIGCTVWLPTIGIQTPSNARHLSQSLSSPPSVKKLSSISKYWRFQSFRLPWWYDNNGIHTEDDAGAKNNGNDETIEARRNSKYPHVVVLGSTFWRNPNVLELAVDTASKRAKITTQPDHSARQS